MGYKKPTGNAFAGMNAFQRSEYEHNYKGALGTKTRVRIMSLAAGDVAKIPVLRVDVLKYGKKPTDDDAVMNIAVHHPGDAEAQRIRNYLGTPLSACKVEYVYRIPVFVFWTLNAETGERVNVNKLRYIEFGSMLKKSIDNLPNAIPGLESKLAFNPETGRPDYEIDIEVVRGDGKYPNYRAVPRIYEDNGSGDYVKTLGVETDEVLAKFIDAISDDWDAVIADIKKTDSVDDIRRRVVQNVEDDDTKGKSVSSKPELVGDDEEAEESVAAINSAPVDEPEFESKTEAPKTRRSSKKAEAPAPAVVDEDESEYSF